MSTYPGAILGTAYINKPIITDSTNSFDDAYLLPKDETIELQDKIKKYLRVNNDLFFDLPTDINFKFLNRGNSGIIYLFEHNRKKYGIKIYKRIINFIPPKIETSDFYINTKYYNVDDITFALFDYDDNYISLEQWIVLNKRTHANCNIVKNLPNKIIIDSSKINNIWQIIINLIISIYNMHTQNNVYHRDIHPKNIIINKKTLEAKFIDLDTICINSDDCNFDIENRYLQEEIHQIKNYNKENFKKYGYNYAQDIDYFAIALVILNLLVVDVDIASIKDNINKISTDNELKKYICDELCTHIFGSCIIHKKIFSEFYDIFLYYCLSEHYCKSLYININVIMDFYNKNFNIIRNFNIVAIDRALKFNGNNKLLSHIFSHAFNNYNVIITETENLDDEAIKHADLVILGVFRLINRYIYKCPYITLSIEPFRCNISEDLIKLNHLPLCEFNTYRYEKCIKTHDFDLSLKTNIFVSFAKTMNEVYDKYSCSVKSFWLPYMLLFLIGTSNTQITDNLKVQEQNFDNRKTDFIYIASNCSNNVREKLFENLRIKNGDTCKSFGKCQHTDDEITFLAQNGGTDWKKMLFDKLNVNINSKQIGGSTPWEGNYLLYSKTKFGFALENSLYPAYITEKIILVYKGGAIPIYWGPVEIKEFFNEKSFYYLNDKFQDPNNPTPTEINTIVDELNSLAKDNSDNGWKKYLNEPVFKNNIVPDLFNYENNSYIEQIINYLKTNYEKNKKIVNDIFSADDVSFKKKYLKYKIKYQNTKQNIE